MKQINITPPDGHEVDEDNSTFSCIVFKEAARPSVALPTEGHWKMTSSGKVLNRSGEPWHAYHDMGLAFDSEAQGRMKAESMLATVRCRRILDDLRESYVHSFADGQPPSCTPWFSLREQRFKVFSTHSHAALPAWWYLATRADVAAFMRRAGKRDIFLAMFGEEPPS